MPSPETPSSPKGIDSSHSSNNAWVDLCRQCSWLHTLLCQWHQFRYFPVTRRLLFMAWQLLERPLDVLYKAAAQLAQLLEVLLKGRLCNTSFTEQLYINTWRTLPIAFILTGFTGLVLGLQLAEEMVRQGGEAYVGGLIAMAMVRELGPVLAGFALLALVGSRYATELAAMNVNSQLEALRMVGVSPTRYLILPRFMASLCALPWLAFLSTVFGLVTAMLACAVSTNMNPYTFWESVLGQVKPYDVGILLLKGILFGAIISLFSCTTGVYSLKNSQAIGQAATQAVVWSFLLMAFLDFVLSTVFY
ncbi:MAG: MlaE family ABC transporter permease [Vampirovibrionales bacterium]